MANEQRDEDHGPTAAQEARALAASGVEFPDAVETVVVEEPVEGGGGEVTHAQLRRSDGLPNIDYCKTPSGRTAHAVATALMNGRNIDRLITICQIEANVPLTGAEADELKPCSKCFVMD